MELSGQQITLKIIKNLLTNATATDIINNVIRKQLVTSHSRVSIAQSPYYSLSPLRTVNSAVENSSHKRKVVGSNPAQSITPVSKSYSVRTGVQ